MEFFDDYGGWKILLIIVLVAIVAGVVFLLVSRMQAGKSSDDEEERKTAAGERIVEFTGRAEELDDEDDDDESDDDEDEKPEDDEPKEKSPSSDDSRPKFRGFVLSQRAVEKHRDDEDRVTTMYASVRGTLDGEHRVKLKLKDVEGDAKKRRSVSIKIKCPTGRKACKAAVKKSKGSAKLDLSEEEKEMAMRILHGALKGSKMDEDEHAKLADMVEKELAKLK